MWEKNNTHIHAFHFPDKDWAMQRSVSRKFRLIRETVPGPGRRAPGRPGSCTHRPRRPLRSPALSLVPLTPLPASAAWPAGQRLQKRRRQNVIIGLIPWKLQVKSRLGLGAAPFPARLFGGIERPGQKGRGEGRRPPGRAAEGGGSGPRPRACRVWAARGPGEGHRDPWPSPPPRPRRAPPPAPRPPARGRGPAGGAEPSSPPLLRPPPGPSSPAARPREPSGVGSSAQCARCAARVPSGRGRPASRPRLPPFPRPAPLKRESWRLPGLCARLTSSPLHPSHPFPSR